MQLFDGKNVLIVFSDPGGAKPLLALQQFIHSSKIVTVSDRVYSFYDDFGVLVSPFNQNVSDYFTKWDIDILLTGTSYTSDIELAFIDEAKKRKIKSISYLDHYTAIKERFVRENTPHLPDMLWVIDKLAKEKAEAAGFNHQNIAVWGNPYHQWLQQWSPSVSRISFLETLGLTDAEKYFVYAPDPLSNVNGIQQFGFDETTVIQDISTLTGYTTRIVLKTHPNQDLKRLKTLVENTTIVPAPVTVDTNTLIYYCDGVIGFFSSFLIEATILNKPVYRFLPHTAKNDPFAGLNIGTLVTLEDLKLKINAE